MRDEQLELQAQQKKLKNQAEILKRLFEDPQIRKWGNVDIAKKQEVILGLIGERPLPELEIKDTFSSLENAQILFRLHPSKNRKDDIFQTLTSFQKMLNKVTDALISEDTSILSETQADIERQNECIELFVKNGKILTTALAYIQKFSLGDLLRLAAEYSRTFTIVDQEKFPKGKEVLGRINDNISPPGQPEQEELVSLASSMRKAEELERLLESKEVVLDDLKEATNSIIMMVIQEYVLEQVAIAIKSIKASSNLLHKNIETLNNPVMELDKNLRESFTYFSLKDYFKEADTQRQKLAKMVVSLSSSHEFISATDTIHKILTESSVLLANFDDLKALLVKLFKDPQSSLNPEMIAAGLLKKYYSESFVLMIKRFLGRALTKDKIINIIMGCPILHGTKHPNVQTGTDTPQKLNDFLEGNLREYEGTWVYKDVKGVMEEAVTKTANQTIDLIGSYSIESVLTTKRYLGDLIDSMGVGADSLKGR